MNGYVENARLRHKVTHKNITIKRLDLGTISYVIIAVTLGLIFLTTKGESTVLSVMIIAIAVIIGIPRPEVLFPVFFVVSLSGDYFGAFPGVGFTRVFGIIIFIGALRRVIASGRVKQKYWKYCILIALTTFISYLNAYVDSFANLMTILLNLIMLFSLTNLNLTKEELEKLFKRTYFATIIAILFFIALLIFNPYIYVRSDAQGMTVAANLNPNTFSQMMAQLGAFCFGYGYVSDQKRAKNLFAYALGFICMYSVIVSGSRAGTLAIILGTFCTILIYLAVKGRSVKHFIMYMLITLVGLAIYYAALATNPHLADRMNLASIIETGGSGRWTYIQTQVLYVIPEHLIFGVGIGTSNEVAAMSQYYSYTPLSSTNIIFSMLTQVGIIGFSAFVLFFRKVIKDAITEMKCNPLLLIPLILIIVAIFNGFGEVVFHERYFWNALSLVALCIVTYNSARTAYTKVKIK